MTEEEHAKKVDLDLVEVINEAVRSSATSVAALDKVLEYKRKNRGLTGFHFSCGILGDGRGDSESIAKDLLAMMRADAAGMFRDCTDEIL